MTLRAGAAFRDITPENPVALYGYPHGERISTGANDPLLATVIVLKGDAGTTVLGSLDLLMVEPPAARSMRRAVADAASCNEADVLISCTHTHSGPVTSRIIGWAGDDSIPQPDASYLESVERALVAAAREAVGNLTPAELAWASADATGVGGNRLEEGGLTDPDCGVLAVRSAADRKMLALALIYGMHPTVMHEDSKLFSGDFPAYARQYVARELGQSDLPICYHMGPAGNQSPRHFVNGQTFAEAERLGSKLGAAVCKALDSIPEDDWEAEPPLGGKIAKVELPRNPIRPLPEAEKLLAEYQANYEKLQAEGAPRAEVRTAECAVFGAEGTVALAQAKESGILDERLQAYNPAEVQMVKIDNVSVIGLPGECFTEYSLEIKHSADHPVQVVSLANGDLQGYIVTPEAAAAGGYEATNSIFAPQSGELMVRAALELVE